MKEMSKEMFDATEDLYEKIFINSSDLAKLLGVSRGWVEKYRRNLIGSRQMGKNGHWFHDPRAIRRAVDAGESIFVKEEDKK